MDPAQILKKLPDFEEKAISGRFFKHSDIQYLINRLPPGFEVKNIGYSVQKRSINSIKWGNGPVKILLWSQMHGNEPTGTMALFDLINMLQSKDYKAFRDLLYTQCTLYLIPMVNPDGAAAHTRRNAQQIDINRDYLHTLTPESKILKTIRDIIKPQFGFNLHDQNPLWSITGSHNPATISLLAPAMDPELSINPTRKKAMLIIADIFQSIGPLLPDGIGLFDDAYEPRAFGDNFQKAGTATILIEGGGIKKEAKKQVRSYFFLCMLSGLYAIATKSYKQQNIRNYTAIPLNDKKLFHILIHKVSINGLSCSMSLNYEEKIAANGKSATKIWHVQDMGDLTGWGAYHVYSNKNQEVTGKVVVNEKASFDLIADGRLILSFKKGILVHSKT